MTKLCVKLYNSNIFAFVSFILCTVSCWQPGIILPWLVAAQLE